MLRLDDHRKTNRDGCRAQSVRSQIEIPTIGHRRAGKQSSLFRPESRPILRIDAQSTGLPHPVPPRCLLPGSVQREPSCPAHSPIRCRLRTIGWPTDHTYFGSPLPQDTGRPRNMALNNNYGSAFSPGPIGKTVCACSRLRARRQLTQHTWKQQMILR